MELLDWGEVQSDLLFLKPILEASGIELDEKELRQLEEWLKSYKMNELIRPKETV